MGARTPKKCTPTILKSSVARPFLWNVGEWWVQKTRKSCTRAESANFFQMVIPSIYDSWLAFLSLDTCSQNETWWFVVSLTKISKNRHFCLVTLRCSPRITWVPEPLRNVPPLFKKTLLPDHFCEMLGSDGRGWLKMAVLELGVHTFFQMVIPAIYSSWLAFLSLDTCSQNETWWFVVVRTKISKNRHFSLMTLRCSTGSHGRPKP